MAKVEWGVLCGSPDPFTFDSEEKASKWAEMEALRPGHSPVVVTRTVPDWEPVDGEAS